MKLYLVQHGAALPEEIDPDRPLSDQGRQDVGGLAQFLADHGVRVPHVWHSGKTRARQTADILAAAVAAEAKAEAHAGLAPNDSIGAFVKMVADWHEDAMLVGHLPFMAHLRSTDKHSLKRSIPTAH